MSQNSARRQVVKAYCAAAEKVLERAQDTEAAEVLAFIRSHGALTKPVGSNRFTRIEDPDMTPAVMLVPYLDTMEVKHSPFAAMLRRAEALYVTQGHLHLLLLRSQVRYSPVWRACVFLHESYHARTGVYSPVNLQDSRVLSAHERDTHCFHNRLIAGCGGDGFRELLDREVAALAKEYERTGTALGVRSLLRKPALDALRQLEKLFGPAYSEEERTVRTTDLAIATSFAFFEQRAPERAAELQANFYYEHCLRRVPSVA